MGGMDVTKAVQFVTPGQFDAWLRKHRQKEHEVVIAIYKKATGKQTVSYDDLLEVALCHGWIDNHGKGIDEERWAIRFVPRRPKSNWSERNRAIVKRLIAEGRMTAAGLATLPEDLQPKRRAKSA